MDNIKCKLSLSTLSKNNGKRAFFAGIKKRIHIKEMRSHDELNRNHAIHLLRNFFLYFQFLDKSQIVRFNCFYHFIIIIQGTRFPFLRIGYSFFHIFMVSDKVMDIFFSHENVKRKDHVERFQTFLRYFLQLRCMFKNTCNIIKHTFGLCGLGPLYLRPLFRVCVL